MLILGHAAEEVLVKLIVIKLQTLSNLLDLEILDGILILTDLE